MIAGVFYKHPRKNSLSLLKILKQLSTRLKTEINIIIGGDYNYGLLKCEYNENSNEFLKTSSNFLQPC